MRHLLAPYAGGRHRFRARVDKFGRDKKQRPTVMLDNVRSHDGYLVADHAWVPGRGPLENAFTWRGKPITFTARVQPYRRSFSGEIDYGFEDLDEITLEGQ